jgi:hypothetical protein
MLTARHTPLASRHKFESLDYEVCDNSVHKADEAIKGPADPLTYRAIKYSICGLIGVSIAVTAFGVNFGVENIAGMRFWLLFRAVKCAPIHLHDVLDTLVLSKRQPCQCVEYPPYANHYLMWALHVSPATIDAVRHRAHLISNKSP